MAEWVGGRLEMGNVENKLPRSCSGAQAQSRER
jgi:hypothetical protein